MEHYFLDVHWIAEIIASLFEGHQHILLLPPGPGQAYIYILNIDVSRYYVLSYIRVIWHYAFRGSPPLNSLDGTIIPHCLL